MATRMILPDYIVSNFIVSNFVPPNVCRRCGRSDMRFKLLYPQLRWGKTDVELVYPLRCPCGGSGCVPIKLPTLLFGYILATVALVDATDRRRSKATMNVSPHRTSNMLTKMFLDFDRLIEADNTSTLRSPPVPDCRQNARGDHDPDDAERIKFGFDRDEWKAFLRRLGLDFPRSEDSES